MLVPVGGTGVSAGTGVRVGVILDGVEVGAVVLLGVGVYVGDAVGEDIARLVGVGASFGTCVGVSVGVGLTIAT